MSVRIGSAETASRVSPSRVSPSRVSPSRVSIGMPVYNAEQWLAEGIECLLAQTFSDFELILSDNASTDGSLTIAEHYARRDSRLRLLRQPRNVGANGNYQAVLRAARGEYFKWASVNDLCAPTFLERCVPVLDASADVVLVQPRTVIFENTPADGYLYEHDFSLTESDPTQRFITLLERIRFNNAMNGLIRRAPLARALPMGTFMSADYLLMAELALAGKYAVLEEPLFYRRMSPEASTVRRGREAAEKHLVPTAKRPLMWQRWRYYLRLLRIASRFPPVGFSSPRAVSYAVRRVFWSRAELASDIRAAVSRVN